jgi:hypothetical protein
MSRSTALPVMHCIGGWVEITANLDRNGKLSSTPAFEPRTFQPVARPYTVQSSTKVKNEWSYNPSPPIHHHVMGKGQRYQVLISQLKLAT